MDRDTWIACSEYLERLGAAEYKQQRAAHRRGKFVYSPSEYHEALIVALTRRDEAAFKAIKLEQGYASALGN